MKAFSYIFKLTLGTDFILFIFIFKKYVTPWQSLLSGFPVEYSGNARELKAV